MTVISRTHWVRQWIAFSIMAALFSCGGGNAEREAIGERVQALETSALTPWPCRSSGDLSWTGTTAELLVADALATCETYTYPRHLDAYLTNIIDKMRMAYDIGDELPVRAWRSLRAGASYASLPAGKNCDPKTGQLSERNVSIKAVQLYTNLYEDFDLENPRYAAQTDLDQATTNLCIAQKLRNLAPGASAGETLLLSEAEQREFLETIRERAQIAMLQFALLGVVFTNGPTSAFIPDRTHRLGALFDWANWGGEFLEKRKGLGRDFAAAVQLHSVVSSEILDLYARNRSGRTPLVTPATSPAAETWGPGSWYQRMLAVAYGGDPLFEANPELAGDIHLRKDAMVGYPLGEDFAIQSDWPDAHRAPFLKTPIAQPQVHALLGLARQFDRLDLVGKEIDDGTCDAVDVERTASRIYKFVEAEVRRADCVREVAGVPKPGACSTALELPTQPPGAVPYRLQEKYRIELNHARTLAAHLAEAMGLLSCPSLVTTAQLGAQDLMGSLSEVGSDNGDYVLHLSRDARFVSPRLDEVAGVYSRRAVLRFPTPGEVRGLGVNAAADLWGLGAAVDAPLNYKSTEAKRTMGAINAQAAVHKMVQDSVDYLRSGQGATARLADYFQLADSILEATGAQTGRVVSFRPSYNAAGQIEAGTIAAGGGTTPGFKHIVEVEVPSSDSFWAPASGFVTELYAFGGLASRMIAAHPQASLFGQKLSTVTPTLPNTVAGTLRSIQNVSDRKLWSATITLGTGTKAYAFVAGRRSLTAAEPTQYRLIAANVRIATDRGADGQVLGWGGALGGRVERQIIARQDNPVVPAFDGFDLPTNWVPPFTAELLGGNPSETSIDKYLTLADDAAKEATTAVEAALDSLTARINAEAGEIRQKAENQARLAAEVGRAQAAIEEDQSKLCGAAGARCIDRLGSVNGLGFFSPPPPLPNVHVLGAPTTCTPGKTEAGVKCVIDRMISQEFVRLDGLVRSLAIPLPVAKAFAPSRWVDAAGRPSVTETFDEFAGGSLQGALLDLLHALEAPRALLQSLKTAAQRAYDGVGRAVAVVQQAEAQTAAAQAQEDFLTQTLAYKCSPEMLISTLYFGRSVEPVSFIRRRTLRSAIRIQ